MIKVLRVDHRLIHGQVAYSWANALDVDCFLVANDEVVRDSLQKTTMKIATPANIKLVMKSVEDSIKALNDGKTDNYKLMIVVKSIEDAAKLVRNVPMLKAINLGGIKEKPNTTELSPSVNVTNVEKQTLEALISEGVKITIQQVPTDAIVDVESLLSY